MAGDTLRGIGKKAIAEALEAADAAAHATEPNGTTGAPQAVAELEARPERSLDELPSERTGQPTNHSGAHAASSITTATTLVQDAPGITASLVPVAAPEEAPAATTTTLVDDAAPLTSGSATPRSGPNRVSFGTMIGHEMHGVQARVAAAVAEADASGLRGTAHGRDVHLPAHPAMAVEPETAATSSPSLGVPEAHAQPAASTSSDNFAPARSDNFASTRSDRFAPARDSQNDFSGGDHNFFDTAPVNDEYEPENPRGRLYTRLAVSGAVVAVVSVVVVAWINSHGSTEEAPPIQVKSQPVAPAPTVAVTPPRPVDSPPHPVVPPRPAEVPPTSTIPSSVPERIAVAVPAPPPARPAAKAPTLAPPAPKPAPVAVVPAKPAPVAAAPAKPAPIAAPAPKSAPVAAAAAPVRELRTPPPPPPKKPPAVAAAAPRAPAPPPARPASPAPPPATRPAPPPVAKAARPESAPAHPVAKASPPARAKAPARAKQKYDPDGTLPLSFE